MVTVNATIDGHQYRSYNATTGVLGDSSTGTYQDVVYTTAYTGANEAIIRAGYFASRRYNACAVFEGLAIDPLGSIGTATVTLTLAGAIDYPVLTVRAYLDENAPNPSISFLPDNQVKTTAFTLVDLTTDANLDAAAAYWIPATSAVVVDVKAILQECVNHSSWQNTGKFVLSIEASPYVADANDGSVGIDATENAAGAEASLTYTLTGTPTITSVSSDDIIFADETEINIVGTNLAGADALRIFKGANSYPQKIDTNTATTITFNAAGNIPVDTGYSLEVTIDQNTVTKTIEVRESTPQGGTGSANVTTGEALTVIDGHEYVNAGTGFPGVWESQASVTSYGAASDRIIVGDFNGNHFKASIKVGPIAIANSATLTKFDLNLSVDRNYKYNDLRIKAVANPDAADISASNIISSQTLTTAEVSENNANWANAVATTFWTQAVNPKPINVLTVAQEVVNHVNWSSGDYIQFVIDFVDQGGTQGITRLFSNDISGGQASTASFTVNDGPVITSVSSDNVIEQGELSCTIVGLNLSSASNLNINKGGISENQTITSNTSTSIVFDVTTGAIVPDTGYTLQFDIGGTTYSTTVEFVTGGGVNSGTVSTSEDGHEYGLTLPASGNPGTFAEQSASGNLIYFGRPTIDTNFYIATCRIGPIAAQRGQAFTQADFTWNIPATGRNYKIVNFDIRAVADPTVSELGASNLISAQTLTTAAVSVQTGTWAGFSSIGNWLPGAEVIDISTLVAEVVAGANWTTGSYIKLVFTHTSFPAGAGSVAFGSEEGGDNPTFAYATGAATNIANINGNNIIRTGDTGVVLSGSDLASATALSITDGTYTETQTILTNTATTVTFDFNQGTLGYGAATLTLTRGGIGYTFSVTLSPAETRLHTVLGATISTGDASLTYNESPALVTGDYIEYTKTSANGFPVTLATTGIPTIAGGTGEDTFTVRAYIASTGAWYDDQTITFLESSYFVINKIPTITFAQTKGAALVVDNDAGEAWVNQDDSDSGETWS